MLFANKKKRLPQKQKQKLTKKKLDWQLFWHFRTSCRPVLIRSWIVILANLAYLGQMKSNVLTEDDKKVSPNLKSAPSFLRKSAHRYWHHVHKDRQCVRRFRRTNVRGLKKKQLYLSAPLKKRVQWEGPSEERTVTEPPSVTKLKCYLRNND